MEEYFFGNRAVAFLDVLGFKEKLKSFNTEAIASKTEEGEDGTQKHFSESANDFISTFKTAINKLDKEKYRYYLFSDNICITSIRDTNVADLQDLLLVIVDLYFEFAKKGYFLRGGIDYGLFIDEEEIAVGWPLVVAYELETKRAIYPRIVLSNDFVNQFQSFDNSGQKIFDYLYSDFLIQSSCETKFINVFLNVFQSDFRENREKFFESFNLIIKNNLEENKLNESIYIKYKWLSDQFNDFIELFITELAFLDTDFDPEEEAGFLEHVKKQKITYGN